MARAASRVGACGRYGEGRSASSRWRRRRRWTPAGSRSTATARRSTPPTSCTTRAAYADSLDERAHAWALQPPSPRDSLAQALHDHAVDEALTGLAGRPVARRRDGRARPGARRGGVRRRRAARRPARSHPHRRDRRWPGGDGGRQPRGPARPPARRRTGGGARPAGGRAVVPPVGRRVGRRRQERRGAGRRPVARDPDLVLRPRADERVRHRDREVLPQRPPRGDPPAGLRRGDRVPPRRRGHRAGGLPGRLRELLRRRDLRRPDGARRRLVLDEHRAGLAAAAGPWPPGGRWSSTCTWSTPSTTRPP